MLKLPDNLSQHFDKILLEKLLSEKDRYFLKKWLRFYWDFCHKYQHDAFQKTSLPVFIEKLRSKGQSQQQKNEAEQAISLFYEMSENFPSQVEEKINILYKSESHTVPINVPIVNNQVSEVEIKRYAGDCLGTQQLGSIEPKKTNLNNQSAEKIGTSWVFVFDQLASEIKMRHYSPKTLKAYRFWVRQFQTFTKSKSYQQLSQQDVIDFLSDLAVRKQVSASSQNQAFNALLFLFKQVLKTEFGTISGVVRAKRKPYIPVVLSREEVNLIFDHLDEPVNLVAHLLYGCGLRLSECLNLRVQDFNFDAGILTIHDGKGKKDRTVPIPRSIAPALKKQLAFVGLVHESDLKAQFSGTFLPDQLERKYKNAAKEYIWQWFFPAQSLTMLSENKELRRYHLHESVVQKSIKKAANDARITKRATPHTFRHSFASHLLQANYDIRTIQQLMGHSDVRTTMIYTHTVPSRTLKEMKSPLDFDTELSVTSFMG